MALTSPASGWFDSLRRPKKSTPASALSSARSMGQLTQVTSTPTPAALPPEHIKESSWWRRPLFSRVARDRVGPAARAPPPLPPPPPPPPPPPCDAGRPARRAEPPAYATLPSRRRSKSMTTWYRSVDDFDVVASAPPRPVQTH